MRLNAEDDHRIRALIRTMSRRSKVYKLLKEELGRLGYWKAKPRGRPMPNHNIAQAKTGTRAAQTYEPLD